MVSKIMNACKESNNNKTIPVENQGVHKTYDERYLQDVFQICLDFISNLKFSSKLYTQVQKSELSSQFQGIKVNIKTKGSQKLFKARIS